MQKQKGKNIVFLLSKMNTFWDKLRWSKILDSVRKEDGMIWENSTETYILPYVKQMTSASSVHEPGHSKPVFGENAEGWDINRKPSIFIETTEKGQSLPKW